MTSPVYLDHNATAPVRPQAREAALAAMAATGNASSVHRAGRRARSVLDEARERVAGLAGVSDRQVVFTSGGTEANNLALRGTSCRRVLVSAVEHPSVLKARHDIETIPVDHDGRVDLEALERMLAASDAPALVSVMAANNETGAIQPIAEVVALAHARCAVVHCDAVQAAGRLDVAGLGADLLTLSGHKLGGIQGAGALVAADSVRLYGQLKGGGQELGLRAGTEALPAIAAFGAAAEAARDDDLKAIGRLRDELEQRLVAAVPGAKVFATDGPRLANTLAIAHPAVDAETLVMSFDLDGIALSAGSACSSGKVSASHVLLAMGEESLAGNAIRISLGPATTRAEIDRCVASWIEIDRRVAARRSAA